MAISSINSGISQYQTTATNQTKDTSFSQQDIQLATNKTILAAQSSVSLQSANEPLSLVYQTAINEIDKRLAPELGENITARNNEAGIDFTPEATAERIVAGSTAFFNAYKEQNPDLSEEEAATQFLSVIQGGIDQGFSEARDILDSLKVLEGQIADDIDQTYEFVQQGLSSFAEKYGVEFTLPKEEPIDEVVTEEEQV